jgi:hypothetical protein
MLIKSNLSKLDLASWEKWEKLTTDVSMS